MDLDPFVVFSQWFQEASAAGISEPNAAALATASKEGVPSCRMVLLKGFDRTGFVIFTNYESLKSQQLNENPRAALTFYWEQLDKQIRIEGTVTKTSREESERYFAQRPRGSQIGAWASRQDAVLNSREELLHSVAAYEKKFAEKEIPLPPFWGGWRVTPTRFEFWKGQPNRLHERYCYNLEKGAWTMSLLAP